MKKQIRMITYLHIVYNFNAFLLSIILLYFRIIFPATGWLADCYKSAALRLYHSFSCSSLFGFSSRFFRRNRSLLKVQPQLNLLRCRIGIYCVNHPLNSHPYSQIRKYLRHTSPIGKW